MPNVLADLVVESEGAATLTLGLAEATDQAVAGDEGAALFKRLGLAVSKYWVCKRAPAHAAEAMECLGGNGYIEESGMPRISREAPLGSIGEGSGNVAALDALRAMTRNFDEVGAATGGAPRLDAAINNLQYRVRRLVELLVLVRQGALLIQHAPLAVADAFCASRLSGDHGRAFGTLPPGVDTEAIISRARTSL